MTDDRERRFQFMTAISADSELEPHDPAKPERRLLLAVIERTVRDAIREKPAHLRRAAELFLEDDAEDDTPFTFWWIANQLHANPPAFIANVRTLVLHLRCARDKSAL